MHITLSVVSKTLVDKPILMAVSFLSPVNIQNKIPASFRQEIVPSTSSYSLSSIAVAPTISRFYSISSIRVFILSSLF